MPRSIRPPDSSLSTASREAVTEGSRVAGLVTHVPRRIRLVDWAMRVRSGYGSRQRTCESNSQPCSNPAVSAWLARAVVRWSVWSGLSVNPNCMVPTPRADGRGPYGITRSSYMSGRRSRKNCQVWRTSWILSRSMSRTSSSSSWASPTSPMNWPRGSQK